MSNDRWNPNNGAGNVPDNEENALDLFAAFDAPEDKTPKKAAPKPASPAANPQTGGQPVNQQPVSQAKPINPQPTVASSVTTSSAAASPATPAPNAGTVRPQVPEAAYRPLQSAVSSPQQARQAGQNAQTSQQQATSQPARQAQQPSARQQREEQWERTPMDEEEEEEYSGNMRHLVRNLILIAVASLAVVALIVFGVFQVIRYRRAHNTTADSSTEISQISQEEVVYEGKELYGVIENVDATAGQVEVYSAETASTISFDLDHADSIVDQYGTDIAINNLHRGQVVNVQYNGTNNAVNLFRLTSRVTELTNAYGAEISGDMLTVSGGAYSVDDHLICMYQGEEYDAAKLSPQQVFNAMILDGHIYTIYITYSTGKLQLDNYEAFENGMLTVTSATGAKTASEEIVAGMQPVEVLEGLNTVTINMNGTAVYSAKVFVVGGETKKLTLPESSERSGSVKLVSTPETATFTIDDTVYAAGETIELDYGQHTMSVTASGYTSVEKNITVSQPYQRVVVSLKNSTTTVSISSALSGSAVYINGTYQGTAPLQVSLEPGTYNVTLVTAGYYDVSTSFTLSGGDLERVLYFSDFTAIPTEEPSESSYEPEPSESSDSSESSESSYEPEPSESSEEPAESSEEPVEPTPGDDETYGDGTENTTVNE